MHSKEQTVLFKQLFFIFILSSMLHARYTNCHFKNKNYTDICKKAVHSGVSYRYANKFLLSYPKMTTFDEITWKYIQPSKITYHRQQEKKANDTLVKYVPTMVANLKKYKKVYAYAQKKYHVNREIIAAVLFKETRLGKIHPKHDAFIVFNTILTRTKPTSKRQKWLIKMSKDNMVAIIRHCYKKRVSPNSCNLASSYAGAVGIPQFMPSSFKYTEGYRHRVANLSKMEDAILSTAKFLNKKAGFKKTIAWDKMNNIAEVENDWYTFSYEDKNASFTHQYVLNKPELAYLTKYVKIILHYNYSINYALGVLRLGYEAHKRLN